MPPPAVLSPTSVIPFDVPPVVPDRARPAGDNASAVRRGWCVSGKRLATCSSDRAIKIWEQGRSGQWEKKADWQAHQASVWKIAWAHPRFGQVLASCSYDHTVTIWEEQEGLQSPAVGGQQAGGGRAGGSTWKVCWPMLERPSFKARRQRRPT